MKVSLLPPEDMALAAQNPTDCFSARPARGAFVAIAHANRGISRGQQFADTRSDSDRAASPGTEDAQYPFGHLDSRSIAYSSNVGLVRVNIDGGPPVPFPTFVGASRARAGSWGKDTIVFQSSDGRGPYGPLSAGRQPKTYHSLDTAKGEYAHVYPWFLLDGRQFPFTPLSTPTAKKAPSIWPIRTHRIAARFSTQGPRCVCSARLHCVPSRAYLIGPGLTYAGGHYGDPVPIAEPVGYMGTQAQGLFSVSQNGILVYSGGITSSGQQLTWFDRTGKELGTVGSPGNGMQFENFARRTYHRCGSPGPENRNHWPMAARSMQRNTESRLAAASDITRYPPGCPTAITSCFFLLRTTEALFLRELNGSGKQTVLILENRLAPRVHARAVAASADGRYLFEERIDPKTKSDIWVLPLREGTCWVNLTFAHSLGVEQYAAPSPSGPWLAYASDENGRLY